MTLTEGDVIPKMKKRKASKKRKPKKARKMKGYKW